MTETKTYSPGAWRAAKALPSSDGGEFIMCTFHDAVKIIHREAKQDELQGLLKAAKAAHVLIQCTTHNLTEETRNCFLEELQAAIKKCEVGGE